MPSSTYRALTGSEIKQIAKNRINREIDQLPYLREGNSFHNANVQVGIVITAFPADVPVPNLDLEFSINSKSLEEVESAAKQIETAEEIAKAIEKLQDIKENAVKLTEELLEKRAAIVFENEIEFEFNGNQPDKTRIENNLPVTVERVKDGKRGEIKVEAMEFKKMAKL